MVVTRKQAAGVGNLSTPSPNLTLSCIPSPPNPLAPVIEPSDHMISPNSNLDLLASSASSQALSFIQKGPGSACKGGVDPAGQSVSSTRHPSKAAPTTNMSGRLLNGGADVNNPPDSSAAASAVSTKDYAVTSDAGSAVSSFVTGSAASSSVSPLKRSTIVLKSGPSGVGRENAGVGSTSLKKQCSYKILYQPTSRVAAGTSIIPASPSSSSSTHSSQRHAQCVLLPADGGPPCKILVPFATATSSTLQMHSPTSAPAPSQDRTSSAVHPIPTVVGPGPIVIKTPRTCGTAAQGTQHLLPVSSGTTVFLVPSSISGGAASVGSLVAASSANPSGVGSADGNGGGVSGKGVCITGSSGKTVGIVISTASMMPPVCAPLATQATSMSQSGQPSCVTTPVIGQSVSSSVIGQSVSATAPAIDQFVTMSLASQAKPSPVVGQSLTLPMSVIGQSVTTPVSMVGQSVATPIAVVHRPIPVIGPPQCTRSGPVLGHSVSQALCQLANTAKADLLGQASQGQPPPTTTTSITIKADLLGLTALDTLKASPVSSQTCLDTSQVPTSKVRAPPTNGVKYEARAVTTSTQLPASTIFLAPKPQPSLLPTTHPVSVQAPSEPERAVQAPSIAIITPPTILTQSHMKPVLVSVLTGEGEGRGGLVWDGEAVTWNKVCTQRLIELYKEYRVYLTDHHYKKKSVWALIATKLRQSVPDSPAFRWNHVENKWKNMTKKFRDCVNLNRCSAVATKCSFYDEIAAIYNFNPEEERRKAAEGLRALKLGNTHTHSMATMSSHPSMPPASRGGITKHPGSKVETPSVQGNMHGEQLDGQLEGLPLIKKKKYAHQDTNSYAHTDTHKTSFTSKPSSSLSEPPLTEPRGGCKEEEGVGVDIVGLLAKLRDDRNSQERARMERLERMHQEKLAIFSQFLDILQQYKPSGNN